MKTKDADNEMLIQFIRWFEEFEEFSMDSRKQAERDRDYYDGKQWSSYELSELAKRGQPPITTNRIAPKIDFMLGEERRTRMAPKAWPRNQQYDEKAAHAATDAIRYVLDYSRAGVEFSKAYEDMLIQGTCGIELHVKNKQYNGKADTEICLKHINWDRLFWDPKSRDNDFSDAKYLGTVVWMDLEDAVSFFGEVKRDILETCLLQAEGSKNSDTFDDVPKKTLWAQSNPKEKRVRVIQVHYRVGGEYANAQWYTAIFCKSGFIEEPAPSWLKNDYGESLPPLILASAKCNRDNERYGVVRNLIDIQDEINKRRSKALWLLTQRQSIGEQGAVDLATVKHEKARPDGHISVMPGMRFEILPNTDFVQGQFELLRESKMEMDAVGAAAALSGKDNRIQSGVSLRTRQEGGLIELEAVKDRYRSLRLAAYRSIWFAIRTYWTSEKWVRVSDDEHTLRWVGLNRPVTYAEQLQQKGVNVPSPEMLDQETVQQLTQYVATENDVKYMDVDIILDETPDPIALQQEEFETIAMMVQTGLPIPPDILIEMSSIRSKEKILSRMRNGADTPEGQAQAQAQAQEQQQAKALATAQAQANIQKTMAQAENLQAQSAATLAEAADPKLPGGA